MTTRKRRSTPPKPKELLATPRANGVTERVTLAYSAKGIPRVDIRRHWTTPDGREVPTKRGVILRWPDDVDNLIRALYLAKRAVRQREIGIRSRSAAKVEAAT